MKTLILADQRGLTLLELLTTLSMVAILSSIAIPSFERVIRESNQSAEVNNFLNSLFIARSEAVKRGERVVLCTSNTGTACNNTVDWNSGWVVFVDDNTNNTIDAGEDTVHVGASMNLDYTLIGSINVANVIRYEPGGDALESGTITMCDPRGASEAEAIIVTAAGKPKVSETAAGGGPLVCPP